MLSQITPYRTQVGESQFYKKNSLLELELAEGLSFHKIWFKPVDNFSEISW